MLQVDLLHLISQIPFESASPKDEAVSITQTAPGTVYSEKLYSEKCKLLKNYRCRSKDLQCFYSSVKIFRVVEGKQVLGQVIGINPYKQGEKEIICHY